MKSGPTSNRNRLGIYFSEYTFIDEHQSVTLQRVSDKYRPTGSDQQEDLATLGSVQLRQTLAL